MQDQTMLVVVEKTDSSSTTITGYRNIAYGTLQYTHKHIERIKLKISHQRRIYLHFRPRTIRP